MIFGLGTSVAQLLQHKFGVDNLPIYLGLTPSSLMRPVTFTQQSHVEKRIRKNGHYDFFGSPLT